MKKTLKIGSFGIMVLVLALTAVAHADDFSAILAIGGGSGDPMGNSGIPVQDFLGSSGLQPVGKPLERVVNSEQVQSGNEGDDKLQIMSANKPLLTESGELNIQPGETGYYNNFPVEYSKWEQLVVPFSINGYKSAEGKPLILYLNCRNGQETLESLNRVKEFIDTRSTKGYQPIEMHSSTGNFAPYADLPSAPDKNSVIVKDGDYLGFEYVVAKSSGPGQKDIVTLFSKTYDSKNHAEVFFRSDCGRCSENPEQDAKNWILEYALISPQLSSDRDFNMPLIGEPPASLFPPDSHWSP